MPDLALNQATIHYRVFGPHDSAHPPVLFVHGILVNGNLWREVAEGLARRGFRCIVPTWPLESHTIPVDDARGLSLPGVAQMINGPISIQTLATALRVRVLRHSPLGFGLLVNRADPDLTAGWLRPCQRDPRICRDLARLLRQVESTDLTTWPSACAGSPNRSP